MQKHLEDYGNITETKGNATLTNSGSFKFKIKITGSAPAVGNTKRC